MTWNPMGGGSPSHRALCDDSGGCTDMKSIRPPVKWSGGKRYLARRIIEQFPPHRIYVEPFGGGASVLLNKPPCDVEVYNDLDLRITRLFRVLRDSGPELAAYLQLTPYSQVEFRDAKTYPPDAGEIQMAACDFVRWRQSFGGKGESWSCATTRARGGMAGDVNAWWTAIDHLPEIIDRIRRVQIMCDSAFRVVPKFDHPEALFYCDPPYVHATREQHSRAVYHGEMSDSDHEMLSNYLQTCKAKVVLSGYLSSLYERLYGNWRRVEFDIANHAAGGKSKRRMTECLWMNF